MYQNVYLIFTSLLLILLTYNQHINGLWSFTLIFTSDLYKNLFLVSKIVARTSSISSRSIFMSHYAEVCLKRTNLYSRSSSAQRFCFLRRRSKTMICVSWWLAVHGLSLLSRFLLSLIGWVIKFGVRFVNWLKHCLVLRLLLRISRHSIKILLEYTMQLILILKNGQESMAKLLGSIGSSSWESLGLTNSRNLFKN